MATVWTWTLNDASWVGNHSRYIVFVLQFGQQLIFVYTGFESFTFTMSKINFYNRPWTLHQINNLIPMIAHLRFYLSLTKMHQRI